MPIAEEFTVLTEDSSSALGKVCRALADRDVNILALQSFAAGERRVTRPIVDNPKTARAVLDSERLTYAEGEIVQTKILHRPGEIARLAFRLGESDIHINYAYCGLEAGTNAPLIFFSVSKVDKAASILERNAGAAAMLYWRGDYSVQEVDSFSDRTRSGHEPSPGMSHSNTHTKGL